MNRRKFLQYMGIGAASAPVAAKAVEKAIVSADPNEEMFKRTIETRQKLERIYPEFFDGHLYATAMPFMEASPHWEDSDE